MHRIEWKTRRPDHQEKRPALGRSMIKLDMLPKSCCQTQAHRERAEKARATDIVAKTPWHMSEGREVQKPQDLNLTCTKYQEWKLSRHAFDVLR